MSDRHQPMSVRMRIAGLAIVLAAGAPVWAQDSQIERGKILFQEEIGCALCHGQDAKGDDGPDIRGRTAKDIRAAKSEVEDMGFLEISDPDIDAIAAYLGSLS